jgi:hypothetical protein
MELYLEHRDVLGLLPDGSRVVSLCTQDRVSQVLTKIQQMINGAEFVLSSWMPSQIASS